MHCHYMLSIIKSQLQVIDERLYRYGDIDLSFFCARGLRDWPVVHSTMKNVQAVGEKKHPQNVNSEGVAWFVFYAHAYLTYVKRRSLL